VEFKEQLKSQVDIAGVVGEYGVRLLKAGPNRYKGLCPFHTEKTPSFNVSIDRQAFHCFGCSVGGDVFSFVMRIEGISFYEALKLLAERHGIPMPKRSLVADEDTRLREVCFDIHKVALDHYRASLNGAPGEAARGYLSRRGVAPDTIERFELGYSDRSGRSLLRVLEQRSYTAAQLEHSGLVAKRDDGSLYERFRNRLMFPIHDESGRTIGFGGRTLDADNDIKYVNSPETPIYKKSKVLYNLHRAKKSIGKDDRAILVEGYMDAIGVSAAGIEGVVASCGTALTSQQVQMLRRHSQKIVVNFDPDTAGANAAERSINLLLNENMQVRIMELDGDLDPDEYCKQRGADAYRQRLDQAKGYFYWLADRVRTKYDVHTAEGVVSVLQDLLPAVQRIADPLERAAIANDVAGYVGVSTGMVLDRFRKAAGQRQEKTLERPKVALRADERWMINALLDRPEIRDRMIADLRTIEAVSRFQSRKIFQSAFALYDSGTPFTFASLHERMEEPEQNLLAEAVFGEHEQKSPEEVLAALDSMRRSEKQNQRDELKARIKELERAGNWQDAIKLMAKLDPAARSTK
jgi:DNA primase